MKRRHFLMNAGLLFSSTSHVSRGADQSKPAEATQVQNLAQKPRVLITSAASRLAQVLAAGLTKEYQVRLTERTEVKADHEFAQSLLGNDASTSLLVRDVSAIVHVAEPLPNETEQQQLDCLTRCTYNLLWAAHQEGVQRLVLLSTLELLVPYEEAFTVSESWRPLPTTNPRILAKHLSEFTCREFARERKISVTVLRLGTVVRAEEVKDRTFDPLWVDERDVVQAVSKSLRTKLEGSPTTVGGWSIFHIGSDSPRARFGIGGAKSTLGYEPQFKF